MFPRPQRLHRARVRVRTSSNARPRAIDRPEASVRAQARRLRRITPPFIAIRRPDERARVIMTERLTLRGDAREIGARGRANREMRRDDGC